MSWLLSNPAQGIYGGGNMPASGGPLANPMAFMGGGNSLMSSPLMTLLLYQALMGGVGSMPLPGPGQPQAPNVQNPGGPGTVNSPLPGQIGGPSGTPPTPTAQAQAPAQPQGQTFQQYLQQAFPGGNFTAVGNLMNAGPRGGFANVGNPALGTEWSATIPGVNNGRPIYVAGPSDLSSQYPLTPTSSVEPGRES